MIGYKEVFGLEMERLRGIAPKWIQIAQAMSPTGFEMCFYCDFCGERGAPLWLSAALSKGTVEVLIADFVIDHLHKGGLTRKTREQSKQGRFYPSEWAQELNAQSDTKR